jgi:phage terminase large subunit-like protein
MAELSPTLSQLTDRYDKEIYSKLPAGGRMVRVAAAVGTNDGPSWSVVICDELHEWLGPKGRGVWNTLTNGTIARKQPMVIQITTAGVERESLCYEQYEYGQKVRDGEIEDLRFFFQWFGVPDEADWRDPEVWKAANPSYGVAVNEAAIRDQMNRKPEGVFRRYFLNQWTEAEVLWLPAGAWEGLTVPGLVLTGKDSDTGGEPTWVAIDAATRYDSCAIVAGQWHDGKLAVTSRIWERPFDKATGRPSESWRLPMAELEEHVRDLFTAYNVQAIAYDPAYITWVAQHLAGDGLPMEEFPQSATRMAPASQALYELIVQQRLEHPGDSIFTRHIKAAAAEATGSGNGAWRLIKGKARRKMDAAIALAMVAALATKWEEANTEPNLWTFTDEEIQAAMEAA